MSLEKPSRSQRLLQRQLRKAAVARETIDAAQLDDFLALVELSYEEFERHRRLTEHSTRLASKELAATISSLSASEELFRSLARCSPNGIVYTDSEGRCLYANEQAEEIFGCTMAELHNYGWLVNVPAEDIHHFERLIQASGDDGNHDWVVEHRLLRPGGEMIWVSTRMAEVITSADELRSGIGWVVNIEEITERKLHEGEMSRLARHDSLTMLANRYSLDQQLAHMFAQLPKGQRLAAAVVDLDRFKLVNDTFGHDAGDSLLVEVAAKLQRVAAKDDIVARLGGDEFAFVTTLGPTDTPEGLARVLSDALHGPVEFGSRNVHIGASIGVALALSKYADPESLLRDADTAMYRAKRSSTARWQVFNESFRAEVTNRFLIESELRNAILNDEIELAYQPIADASNYKVVGLEALARWNNPRVGSVPPEQFTSIAEDLGLIPTLGEQLLDKACAQLQHWRSTSSASRHVKLSFNTSPLQLRDPEFPKVIRRALARNGLPPSALMIEITENVIVDHRHTSFRVLEELRSIGLAIAIDDFGTGYSSLSYLDRLPVDYLKIDKSFVSGMKEGTGGASSKRLAETIIELALRFGLTPVGEGVETEYQRKTLLQAGCALFQGHLFAEAMFPDDERLRKILADPESALAPSSVQAD